MKINFVHRAAVGAALFGALIMGPAAIASADSDAISPANPTTAETTDGGTTTGSTERKYDTGHKDPAMKPEEKTGGSVYTGPRRLRESLGAPVHPK